MATTKKNKAPNTKERDDDFGVWLFHTSKEEKARIDKEAKREIQKRKSVRK